MTQLKRFVPIPLLFLLFALLTGCASVSARAGVDADNTAYISYRLECDTEDGDARMREGLQSGMEQLAEHYIELGFTAEHSFEGRVYWLEVTRTERRGSLEESFVHLEEMLRDESISLFTNVDFAFAEYDYHTAYIANVGFTLVELLDTVDLHGVPQDMLEEYEKALPDMTSSLTLTIPGSEIVQASGGPEQLSGFVQSRAEGGDSLISVSLATLLSSDEAQAIRDSLLETEPLERDEEARQNAAALKQVLTVVCVLCFFGIAACVVVLVDAQLARRREKRE